MATSIAQRAMAPSEVSDLAETFGHQGGISKENLPDSGYVSPESQKPDAPTPTKVLGIYPRLLFLDLDVDPLAIARFILIQPHFERLLLEHVNRRLRRGGKHKPMSTRLLMIGSSRDDATPEVAIFCQPEQHRSIKRFAKQQAIAEICQSSIPGQQSFNITVIPEAPRLRTTSVECGVSVFADHARPLHWERTLCGAPISLQGSVGESRNATCGGLVRVVMEDDEIYCYGITAGHVLDDLYESDHNSSDDEEHEADAYESDGDDDDGDDDNFEYDMPDSLMGNLTSTSLPFSNGWVFQDPFIIGQMIKPDTRSTEVSQYYDWALFRLVSSDGHWMNKLPTDARATIVPSEKVPGKTGGRRLYMIAGRTVKRGYLSPSSGRILIGPSQGFVDAYAITVDDENGICDGDSGSWVVDSDTFELYGHLVASDVFNSGYVIPIAHTFCDIKQRLGAKSVGLPTVADILSSRDYLINTFLSRVEVKARDSSQDNYDPPDSGYGSNDVSIPTSASSLDLGVILRAGRKQRMRQE